ncbi:hypothetical protein DCAR_0414994 [Daucus carota subsp. sativus]|uniref:S-protein homolog n=1 Tax=Daucus carota subsp. sativus TaxID=79200 RepID=A0A165A4X3_DAUCS|nr:hypothetical protein DCAR_0414994 [Daucus carota subsp. sativus]
MKTQSSPSNHLLILTLIVTVGFAIFVCVSSAGYNLVVTHGLDDDKPLKVDCPPNPSVTIRKGARNAWHFDHLPPPGVYPLACNFTWNGRKTFMDRLFSEYNQPAAEDVYLVAKNKGIYLADRDMPYDPKNGDWKLRGLWMNETQFNTDPCDIDIDNCSK